MRASVLVGVFWRGEELAAGRGVAQKSETYREVAQVHDMAVVLCGVFLGTTFTEPLDFEGF